MRMTIGKKLWGGTLTIVAVSAASGYFTSRIIGQVRDLAGSGLTNATKTMDSVGNLNTRLAMVRFAQRGVLLYTLAVDAGEAAAQQKRLSDTFTEIRANLVELRPLVNTVGARQSLERFGAALDRYEELSREVVADSVAGRTKDGIAVLKGKSKPVGAALEAAAAEVASEERNWVSTAMMEVNRQAGIARWIEFAGLLAQLLTAVGLSVISWSIVKSLRHSAVEMSRVADAVRGEAGQAAERGQSLASGASAQAAAIEQTSASTEEILTMTARIGENSQHAAECMEKVATDVVGTESALARALEAMQRLTASQGKIAGIIHTIDGIAFQTNLLALNAAVEAARSGQAGAGFAVVADEVRSLARRCAEAAQSTAQLIQESAAGSAETEKTLRQVEISVRAITQSAAKSKALADEVHASCRQQSTGMQQISQAILAMSQVTQKAASTADEEAALGADMLQQMNTLTSVVDAVNRMVRDEPEHV
jgi:methyl-accepting chemotaxis protein/methyl-accepting chemotaxis protein-1 (serine sensor receptor)